MRHSVAAALLLASCSQTHIVTPPRTNACAIAANDAVVTCDGKPFATIKTYFCFTEACPANALSPAGPKCSCQGLAVLYEGGTVAWLYRGSDLADALVRGYYEKHGDCETKGLCVAGLIRLSPEGRYLRWWNSFTWYEYSIVEGTRRKVDDDKFQ
jgi:hypothetical protein